ncbi:peptidyl-prolyl cis-trans isomerase SDCCAG10 [Rhizoctonia solani AG-1 IB]|uniref:Peptidyl-prolyl cis-trans isomerase SDCCAG10 n=1 Tax=Thanatephorus cucumeris (strain AG1-IB / isolate 7/3/14) TaxID=1108050 RepID=M5BLW8_THACB|nr:peptidyl-prolyl cis-trans isomerase SDCCAG10 [Rhizoctonia solani AG-1 IB]
MARENAQRAREEATLNRQDRNVALLSFGDNAEAEDEPVIFTKKSLSRPDLVDNPDTRSAVAVPEPPRSRTKVAESASKPTQQEHAAQDDSKPKKVDDKEGELTSIRKKHKSEKDAKKQSEKTELEKMEEAVRKLARRHEDSDSEDEREAKKPKGPSQLELELAKYKKGRADGGKKGKGKGRDEGDLLAALSSFRGRLQKTLGNEDEDEDVGMDDASESKEKEVNEQLQEVDNDSSWIGHKLKFAKDDGSETRRAEHEYEVIDPRARNNQAKMEERERKANKRSHVGQAFQKGRR